MKSKFLFGIHCHQPVDNFSSVVDMAIEKSYKPFFEIVSKYPTFHFSVHFSGWLFEYIKTHDKNLFKLIQKCYSNGQIEFFTGGFYEPILASIPSRDRVGQIKKLNDFLFDNFSATPKGLWLTERVWDSSIIDDILRCGVEYVTVDDYHFICAGFDKDKLNGYFLSENGGEQIKIFPINKSLRYVMPFKKPAAVLDEIRKIEGAGVLFDDGEKFGLWPKTYDWVYTKHWLKDFLDEVSKDKTISTQTYSEYISENRALGIAYLPNVSYYEMGEWSLKAKDTISLESLRSEVVSNHGYDTADKFVKGGIWKNFLVKYPESNRIHKRALELAKLASCVNTQKYTDTLYMAQTNDALWHGVFGGLYLGCLRDNAYKFIIECDNLYKQANPNIKQIVEDINFDGYDEVRFLTKNFTLMFESKNGAQLTELGLRDKLFNIQNSLTRRYEAYHDKIFNPPTPEPISEDEIETIHNLDLSSFSYLKDEIAYDWYDKNSFVDHITDDNFSLENFKKCSFREYGDFANQPFEILNTSENAATFVRNGGIYDDSKISTALHKTFTMTDSGFDFETKIDTQVDSKYSYVCEINLHLPNPNEVTINNNHIKDKGLELKQINKIEIKDKVLNKTFTLNLDFASDLFVYTVDTVSQNEEGFELSNQAICFGIKVPLRSNTKLKGCFNVSL